MLKHRLSDALAAFNRTQFGVEFHSALLNLHFWGHRMSKPLFQKNILIAIGLFSIFFVHFTQAWAQELPFFWDYINVEIDLQENGDK